VGPERSTRDRIAIYEKALGPEHPNTKRACHNFHACQCCIERALTDGPLAALDDRPRPGEEPTISAHHRAFGTEAAAARGVPP
jgi:hypothetical protein